MSSNVNRHYVGEALPMVNETNMKNYNGKIVIIHGKVSSFKNNILYILTGASETKTEIMIKGFKNNVKQGNVVKIIGKLYPDNSLEYVDDFDLSSTENETFNLDMLNTLINHQGKRDFIKAMFQETN